MKLATSNTYQLHTYLRIFVNEVKTAVDLKRRPRLRQLVKAAMQKGLTFPTNPIGCSIKEKNVLANTEQVLSKST